MTATSFLAIAPHGAFDVEALEVISNTDGTALVRIIHGGSALAVRIPTGVLQQQIAQLPATEPPAARTGARVLFSPLPGPATEASGVTSTEPAPSPAAASTSAASRVTPGDLATRAPARVIRIVGDPNA